MITNKQDYREYLHSDNQWLLPRNAKEALVEKLAYYPARLFRKYLKLLRKQEYCLNTARGNKLKGLMAIWYEGRKNRLGMRLVVDEAHGAHLPWMQGYIAHKSIYTVGYMIGN